MLQLEFNSYLKGYLHSDKTGPLGYGVVLPWPPPSGIYLESKACWCEDLRILVIGDEWSGTGTVCNRSARWQSVPSRCIAVAPRWEKRTESELLWQDENNGGYYIFPGKQSPDDQFSDQRREIDLVAQTEPISSGVPVYFKVWDVDDPFDQLRGPNHADGVTEIPNVAVVDSNDINGVPTGNDNRGQTDPAVKTYVANTDSNGEARITVTVSMQPGNNYRGTASIFSGAYSGPNPLVTQADGDALSVKTDSAGKFVKNGHYSSYSTGLIVEPVMWSSMLTVWRKVHVELDSMAAPDYTNTQIGSLPFSPNFNSTTNRAIMDISSLDADWKADKQHKVGRIFIEGHGSFTTVNTLIGLFDKIEIM